MKKKIILLVLCGVLLLIFTSISYAGFDPNYMEREEADPWDRQLCPQLDGDQSSNFLVLSVSWDLYLVFGVPSKLENLSNLHGSISQKLGTSHKRDSLDKNETEIRK